jgi:hypothetical protein
MVYAPYQPNECIMQNFVFSIVLDFRIFVSRRKYALPSVSNIAATSFNFSSGGSDDKILSMIIGMSCTTCAFK